MITEQAFLDLQNKTSVSRANLIRLELPSSTQLAPAYLYFTDFYRDISFEGNLYVTSKITGIGSVKLTRELSTHKSSIKFTGLDQQQLNYALDDDASFLNKKITVKVLLMEKDTEAVIPLGSNSNAITILDGLITNVNTRDDRSDRGTATITWEVANHFHYFEEVNGRITDDHDHRGIVVVNGQFQPSNATKRPEYSDDLGFEYANKTVDVLAKYQTKEKRYKLKSSRKGGLSGLMGGRNFSLQEYDVVVTREVDLRFDLSAKYLPVAYGVQQITGTPVFADTLKDDPSQVFVVYAFCEGEIEGFLDIFIDDKPIVCYDDVDDDARICFGRKRVVGNTLSVAAPNPPSTTSPSVHGQEYIYDDGAGEMRFWTYHGLPNQAASSIMVSTSQSNNFYLQGLLGRGTDYWSSNHRLLDTAYIVVKFRLSDLNGGRTSIPEISAEVLGKKVAVYNSGGLVSTNKTSIIPAWQILDYITSTRFGGKVKLDEVDIPSFIDVANKQSIIDTNYQASWVPFWRFLGWETPSNAYRYILQTNPLIPTEDSVFQNLESLLTQSRCALNKVDGKYRLTVESENTPDAVIDLDKEAVGNIQFKDLTGSKKFNTVNVNIRDPALAWKNNPITMYNSTFKAQDKGIEKRLNLVFPYITNYYTARNLADRELKKSRYSGQLSIELPFYYLYKLKPNSNVLITYNRYSWKGALFLVDQIDILPTGNISVVLERYAPNVFINSGQANNATGQTPTVTNLVLPPRNLVYTPAPAGGTVGRNGTLSWNPSYTSDIVYYTVIWSGAVEAEVVPIAEGLPANALIKFHVEGLSSGEYTFAVRAVSVDGTYSKPLNITVQINSAINLPRVNNFRVTNLEPGYTNRFIGSSVNLAWSAINTTQYPVNNISYDLEIYDADLNVIIRTLNTTDTSYSYTLSLNKSDYQQTKGTLGIHRNLKFRIRAKGDSGAESVTWAEIL